MIGLHVGAHHGLGRTTHMHEDERRVFSFGNGKHVGITRSRRNIVDDIGSPRQGGAAVAAWYVSTERMASRISPADFEIAPTTRRISSSASTGGPARQQDIRHQSPPTPPPPSKIKEPGA